MNLNDTAKLYQLFGGQAGDYQELRRSDQAKLAKQRWPLLAWLDLSALHVSEAPKVQLGETPLASAAVRPAPNNPPLSPAFNPQFTSAPSSPLQAPMTPVAPSLSPAARAMAGKPVAPPQPAWLPAAPVAQAVPPLAPADTRQKPPLATGGPATTSVATAPYLQQLLDPPARLQALASAPHVVAPVAPAAPATPAVTAPVAPSTSSMAAPNTQRSTDGNNNTLADIFSRIAQPAPSSTNPTQPAGSLWSNLTSRL